MSALHNRIAAVALAIVAGAAHAGDWETIVSSTRADKWVGVDKRMHLGAGIVVSASALAVTGNRHEAFAVGVAVAAAKELYDLRHTDKHTASGKDFAVTVVGAAVGAYVPGLVIGPRYIGYRRAF